MDVSVVIPTYRNAAVLPELMRRLDESLSSLETSYEIILVDDGNTDETWNVIQTLVGQHPNLRAIRLSRNFGQHPAIGAGFRAACGRRIALMDADLEDRPEALPPLLAKLDDINGVDIVFTVIANPNQLRRRRVSSTLFQQAFSLLSPIQWPSNVGTLRVFTRQVLDAMLEYEEYNVLYGPLMFFIGFRYTFVEVARGSSKGRSSYTFLRRLNLATSTFVSYTNLPANMFLVGGAVALGFVLLYVAALLIQYALFEPVTAVPGLTLLALLISASISINLIALGVLGHYVFRVYQEVLSRPRYHVMARLEGSAHLQQGKHPKFGEPP